MRGYDIATHLQSATLELDEYMDGLDDPVLLDPHQDHQVEEDDKRLASNRGVKRRCHDTSPDEPSRKKKKQMRRNKKRKHEQQPKRERISRSRNGMGTR